MAKDNTKIKEAQKFEKIKELIIIKIKRDSKNKKLKNKRINNKKKLKEIQKIK